MAITRMSLGAKKAKKTPKKYIIFGFVLASGEVIAYIKRTKITKELNT